MPSKGLFIYGKWMKGKGKKIVSHNPATQQILWQDRGALKEQVDIAVKSAMRAFKPWALLDVKSRCRYLRLFEQALLKDKERLSILISQETGKPYWESRQEVQSMVNKISISIQAYEERCRERIFKKNLFTRATRFRPHGVVAVLGPFNFPGHLPNGHIIPALLAGNTIVFKPSEKTPLAGQKIVEIWQDIGLPKGVINLIQGGKEVGKALSQHPQLNGLFFTGSLQAGLALHRTLAEHPEKILSLELGGNNPLIVTNVKDLEAASYIAIQSAFMTSGQRCSCARRLIVPQGKLGDEFIEKLLGWVKRIRVGFWADNPEPFMGPVISQQTANALLNWQKYFIERGAEVLCRMRYQKNCACLLTPGVLDVTDVKGRPDVEIFGPLLQLIRVKNFREALKEANRTCYGLTAGLLSDRKEDYKEFFYKIRAGIINWNQPLTGASSEAPFGGIGLSGNYRPSAFFAADYCSYPVASMEKQKLTWPSQLSPGIVI